MIAFALTKSYLHDQQNFENFISELQQFISQVFNSMNFHCKYEQGKPIQITVYYFIIARIIIALKIFKI